jgi:hypothetical protein
LSRFFYKLYRVDASGNAPFSLVFNYYQEKIRKCQLKRGADPIMENLLDIKIMKPYYHRKGGKDKMKKICEALIVVAAISLVLGVISRLIVQPFIGIEAQAFLQFTQACLLFAIAIAAREWMIAKGK